MERVIGVFFMATDKVALGGWYRDNLGVPPEENEFGKSDWVMDPEGDRIDPLEAPSA